MESIRIGRRERMERIRRWRKWVWPVKIRTREEEVEGGLVGAGL